MLFNNAVSAGVGLVPFVGDVLLAVYKANSRNAALLDEFLRIRGSEFLKIRETEERGENNPERATNLAADMMEQVKPGTGMTPLERYTNSKDTTGSSFASSAGVAAAAAATAPTPAKSGGLFGMQFPVVSKSGPKGRFVENMEL